MTFRRIGVSAASALILAAPFFAAAQNAPSSQVIITAQLGPNTSAPAVAPIINVSATNPTMSGVLLSTTGLITYASAFNDTRTVTFVPGSYTVTATGPGYFTYSNDCSGFTPLSGAIRTCVITYSTTPPPSANPCTAPYWGNGTCTPPTVPYQGPLGQSTLTCSPSYQNVPTGQPATFKAEGGTPGIYNWTTPDRTFLNTSGTLSTIFQTTGTQTVIVSNGNQTATCTVNIGGTAAGVAISYPGTTPSVTASYVPAFLPNTGFGPQDSAALAFALVLLLGAGFLVAPYVRKAFTVALG
jgi:hypothetical protein